MEWNDIRSYHADVEADISISIEHHCHRITCHNYLCNYTIASRNWVHHSLDVWSFVASILFPPFGLAHFTCLNASSLFRSNRWRSVEAKIVAIIITSWHTLTLTHFRIAIRVVWRPSTLHSYPVSVVVQVKKYLLTAHSVTLYRYWLQLLRPRMRRRAEHLFLTIYCLSVYLLSELRN